MNGFIDSVSGTASTAVGCMSCNMLVFDIVLLCNIFQQEVCTSSSGQG